MQNKLQIADEFSEYMALLNTYFCIAHGGASSVCPPGHTMESLRKAIEIGASMLYVEVRVTQDQELIAWPSLQRVVGEEAIYLRDHPLDEWRRITGGDPAPVTTLDDVLELVAQTRCGVVIEIRVPGIENTLARKLRMGSLPYESLLVATSNDASRTVMRSLDPNIPLAHRFKMDHQAKVTPDLLHKLDSDAVIWPASVLTREVTRALKSSGIAVYGGIVNLAQEMRRLRNECGVDGIVTPYPDLLLSLQNDPVRHAA